MTPPKVDEDEKKRQRLAKLAAWKANALGGAGDQEKKAKSPVPKEPEPQPEEAVVQDAW